MDEQVVLSIEELAPPPPRFVDVFGERYQLVDPESLDLLAIARIEWLAQLVRGGQDAVPFTDSREFARAVRDIIVPTLDDQAIERMTPTQAYGFAVHLITWALAELGKQLPPMPLLQVVQSTPASSSRGSNGSMVGRRTRG